MNNCDNCDPCPPCQNQVPETCEPLPISTDPIRIVVENVEGCKGTVVQPTNPSLLQYKGGNIIWQDGSPTQRIQLPNLVLNNTTSADSLAIFQADGQNSMRLWKPSTTGDKYIVHWDGTQWVIDTLTNLLPSGNGVLVKVVGNLQFINGSDGDLLQIIAGNVAFDSNVAGSLPIGTVIPYPSANIPSGWVLCNGGLYGRTQFNFAPQPNLFAVIGTTYGSGDGLTNFAVPDLRGMFIRGLDSGRGIDPARVLGTQQVQGIQSHNHGGVTDPESSHTHSFTGSTGTESTSHTHFIANNTSSTTGTLTSTNYIRQQRSGSSVADYDLSGSATIASLGLTSTQNTSHTHSVSGTSSAGTSHSHTIQSEGISETRPINLAMNFIIKT